MTRSPIRNRCRSSPSPCCPSPARGPEDRPRRTPGDGPACGLAAPRLASPLRPGSSRRRSGRSRTRPASSGWSAAATRPTPGCRIVCEPRRRGQKMENRKNYPPGLTKPSAVKHPVEVAAADERGGGGAGRWPCHRRRRPGRRMDPELVRELRKECADVFGCSPVAEKLDVDLWVCGELRDGGAPLLGWTRSPSGRCAWKPSWTPEAG